METEQEGAQQHRRDTSVLTFNFIQANTMKLKLVQKIKQYPFKDMFLENCFETMFRERTSGLKTFIKMQEEHVFKLYLTYISGRSILSF